MSISSSHATISRPEPMYARPVQAACLAAGVSKVHLCAQLTLCRLPADVSVSAWPIAAIYFVLGKSNCFAQDVVRMQHRS